MIALYKPNKANKGFACSFNVPTDFSCVYATLLRQYSWNDESKTGSFRENRNDPENRVNIKLSFTEAAAILDCLERNRDFSAYHDADRPKSIKFEVWKDKVSNTPKGYSFSVTVSDKQNANYKNSLYLGINFAEGRLLREFLTYAMRKHFKAVQAENALKKSQWANVVKDVPKIDATPRGDNVPSVVVDEDKLVDL